MPTELRQLQASDAPALQRLFELTPAYQAAISHAPLCAQAAEEALTACPPTQPFSAKQVIGRWEAGELTAVLDLLRGYPEPTTAYLGLLLVGEPWQGPAAVRRSICTPARWLAPGAQPGCACRSLPAMRSPCPSGSAEGSSSAIAASWPATGPRLSCWSVPSTLPLPGTPPPSRPLLTDFSGNPLYMVGSMAKFALSRLVRPEF